MEETIKERLTAYLRYKGINKSEFGRIIGVSNAYISSIRKSIQPDKAEKIASSFPDFNIAWLMTGEGDMIKGTIAQNAKGDNNTQIAGNGNHINNAATLDKAIDEISAMRKLLETAIQNNKEQADKFFSIIERITNK